METQYFDPIPNKTVPIYLQNLLQLISFVANLRAKM